LYFPFPVAYEVPGKCNTWGTLEAERTYVGSSKLENLTSSSLCRPSDGSLGELRANMLALLWLPALPWSVSDSKQESGLSFLPLPGSIGFHVLYLTELPCPAFQPVPAIPSSDPAIAESSGVGALLDAWYSQDSDDERLRTEIARSLAERPVVADLPWEAGSSLLAACWGFARETLGRFRALL
jgi:hypothetical protein